ncbi:MAG: thiolase domain-containing protein, partial [Chloroflexi bacterium]|nr:thiolase domain-containing protein [Chloroflexota bacterium]
MRKVAVVGVGQTTFRLRKEETTEEMVFEASDRALRHARLTRDDIDAVVFGTGPDAFDGMHMNGENVVEAAGAWNKPFLRNTTGGATGVVTPIVGYWHVASGLFDTVLVVCEEKMSPPRPHAQGVFIANWDEVYHRQIGTNVIRMASLEMSRYMHESGATKEAMALVAVKNKGNAMANPNAHLPARITVEDVLNSEVLTWPVNRMDVSPTSDGAAAAIFTTIEKARELTDKVVTIDGIGWNQDSFFWETYGVTRTGYLERSAKQAYDMAGIKNPRKEIDVAEIYDPFTYKECQHAEGLGLANPGEGWKLAVEGSSWIGGRQPINPSGGLLGVGNPIAAAGMMKFCETVLQLRGEAAGRQVPGNPRTGMAHAWGGVFEFSG